MVACAPVPHHSMSDSSGASRISNPAGKLLSVSADLELLRISCKPGNITKMKAISPIRSVRSCYEAVCCISDQSLSITRCRSPTEELSDMNDCYSKLKELVPSIPQNKTVSQMEILQHVIDYIFDLQIALENETDAKNKPDMFMSMKTNEMTCNFSKEDGAMCH